MYIQHEHVTADEYIDFLKRTDLGSQYPKERFRERIEKLVKNASISIAARAGDGQLIGVCFGITDFAYWLFLTDLGVDRRYVQRGIGKRMVEMALEAAGGRKDIIMYTCANQNAIPFYEKIGMSHATDVMERNDVEWTSFVVE